MNLGDTACNYMDARAVVFGATGFVGRWVARALTQEGARILLPVRDLDLADDVFNTFSIEGEVVLFDFERDSVSQVVSNYSPDIIFNLAGYGIDRSEQDEDLAYLLNSKLPAELCAAPFSGSDSKWKGRRLVHAGTAMEYGAAKGDLCEGTSPIPTTVYGKSKLAGTEEIINFCTANTLDAAICRIFAVYGPGEHENRLLPLLLRSANTSQKLELTMGSHRRDFCYVGEIAEGLLRIGATQYEGAQTVNLATGKLTTIKEFIEIAADELSLRRSRLDFGALPTRLEEMDHFPVNIETLKELTGWVPGVSIREGIRLTTSFYDGSEEEE